MSDKVAQKTVPKALIHKQILDAAADKPEASMEELADDVPSATTDLIERVLHKYGDPATKDPSPPVEAEDSVKARESVRPDPADLSSKQREVLQAIYDHPDATQRELAEHLGVSDATVSNRANSIEGFDWDDRQEFTKAVFERESRSSNNSGNVPTMNGNSTESKNALDNLTERVSTVEQQVDDLAESNTTQSGFEDPDLAHKVIHACMKSDSITEDEELRLLQELLR